MDQFKIRIVEDNGDIHTYTDVSNITIIDNNIKINREGDELFTHQLDQADEIHIKTSR